MTKGRSKVSFRLKILQGGDLKDMLIVGERINTSRHAIEPAVKNRDKDLILQVAREQIAAGASFVDVNAGTLVDEEPEALKWLVQTIQSEIDVSLCIDSPNPLAIEAALKVHKGKAMVNSVTAEEERFERIASLVKDYGASVVALCMDGVEIPQGAQGRFEVASVLVERLTSMGIPIEDIYIDPLVQPISTGAESGLVVLETISQIMEGFKGIHTICGLSNISFGLPSRKLLNQTFLVMCMMAGLDSAILDPLDNRIMALIKAGNAILAKDEFCLEYITAYRDGKFE